MKDHIKRPFQFRRCSWRIMVTLILLGCACETVRATPVINSATGITSPAQTLTFNEVSIARYAAVTTQFIGYGVTFSGLYYNPDTTIVDYNIEPPSLGNYYSYVTQDPIYCTSCYSCYCGLFGCQTCCYQYICGYRAITHSVGPNTQFAISFSHSISAAALAIRLPASGSVTLHSYRLGIPIETFTASTAPGSATNFFGFASTEIDEITVTVPGDALIDTLQIGAAPLPPTIFVANQGASSVEKYDTNGVPTVFAPNESGPGLVFDDASNLYVENFSSINKFGSDGSLAGTFAQTGLSGPQGMAFDGAGNLYIANISSNTVEVFDSTGVGITFASSNLSSPVGLAFDILGNLYVANSGNNTIEKFAFDGADLGVFANTGLNSPHGLAFDSSGNLYVANTGNNTVHKFSKSGTDLGTFANSHLLSPYGLAFAKNGNLYVANYGANTIESFAPNGTDLGQAVINTSGLNAPTFLALQPSAIPTPAPTPTISNVPSDASVEAFDATGAVFNYTSPTAIAADASSLSVVCAPSSGSLFPLGITKVACTATDGIGATARASFSVTVQDTTPPAITVPSNILAEATGPSGAVVTFSAPTWTDAVDGSGTATPDHASGSTFPVGTTTVTCSHTDSHGNTGSKSFTITVEDTTPPVVTVPANITAEATGPNGAVVTFSSTWTDAVDGNGTATADHPSGSTFSLGTTTVTCSHTDTHGNTGSKTFTVTVQDTTPPTITVPANITAEASGPNGAIVNFTAPTWTDAVDGAGTASADHASGATYPFGATTVTCSHTDAHGNTGSKTFTITVQDTTSPVITVPTVEAVEADGPDGAMVTFSSPSATDTVDGSVPVSYSATSGSIFPVGTTTVTCSATDSHNNTGTTTFNVVVTDSTPPVIVTPGNISVKGTKPKKGTTGGSNVTFNLCANDIVDGPVTNVVASPASGSVFPYGAVTTVNVTATDAHNNVTTTSFTVSVTSKLSKSPKKAPTVSISVDNAAINESGIATFTVSSTGVLNPSEPTTVGYQIGGSATNPSQYTLTGGGCGQGELVIPAGSTSAQITLHARNTSASSGNETISLTLLAGSGYAVSSTGGSATVTINNAP